MRISLIACLVAASLVLGGCGSPPTPAPAPQAQFAALSGETFSTSDLRGKVVLVNFWATTCSSCVKEMPRMIEAYRKFGPRGYEVVAVALSYDPPEAVAAFTERRGLPFKVALDTSGDIARTFGGTKAGGTKAGSINVTPTSFLIDKQGRIVGHYVGEPDWAEFHIAVEKALAS